MELFANSCEESDVKLTRKLWATDVIHVELNARQSKYNSKHCKWKTRCDGKTKTAVRSVDKVISANFLWGWEGSEDVVYAKIFWRNKKQSLGGERNVMLGRKTTLLYERKKCFSHRSLLIRESGEKAP